MIALVSTNSTEYQELADITWHQNKAVYCQRHNFYAYSKIVEPHAKIGFEKFRLAQSAFQHKINGTERIDWVWATGTDSLVTDFTNDLSELLASAGTASLLVSTDINGVNADSFLVRNDPTGRFIVERTLELEPSYDTEQHVIDDLLLEFPSMFKILPQRTINSYNYDLYSSAPEHRLDKLGTNGHWQYGDLLIHWPGFSGNPEMRVEFAKEWMGKIKYE